MDLIFGLNSICAGSMYEFCLLFNH
uniref:Uncharacterized protein n=1 Tax=Rhizophora mucronata TaxID=61149 RepID=A0A2P2P5X4_RHIMU